MPIRLLHSTGVSGYAKSYELNEVFPSANTAKLQLYHHNVICDEELTRETTMYLCISLEIPSSDWSNLEGPNALLHQLASSNEGQSSDSAIHTAQCIKSGHVGYTSQDCCRTKGVTSEAGVQAFRSLKQK